MWSGLALRELRAHVVWVLVDDPGDEIGDALSGRMWNHPELEVLGAVVEAEPVPVVDELVRCELAAEDGLHDELVLSHPASSLRDIEGPVAIGVDGAGPVGCTKRCRAARVAVGEVTATVHVAHALATERGSPTAADHADASGGERLFVVTLAEAA
jgi:hypothetical protein